MRSSGAEVNHLEPFIVSGLADGIAYRLEQAILTGALKPGHHLAQDELSRTFGVSRTPIREALRKLQAQNLVVVVPNKGATVRIPTAVELDEVWVVRAELEGFACELACEQIDEAAIEDIDRAQASIDAARAVFDDNALEPEEEEAFHATILSGNDDFHGAIARAAHNDQLATLCYRLRTFFPNNYVWRALGTSSEAEALYATEHHFIRDALVRRDKVAARAAMKQHIDHSRQLLIPYLSRQGFWD
jgi:DNA-binding GntR family transcriptional regulator